MKRNRGEKTGMYVLIEEYAFLADCHSSALVSRHGSIDWCCMPRSDSASIFCRVLDHEKGGYCRLAPDNAVSVSRRYIPRTLILETTFKGTEGEARLIDCFPLRRGRHPDPYQQIIRMVEGVSGSLLFGVHIAPRFEYGAILPWVVAKPGGFAVYGGSSALSISSDFPLRIHDRHDLTGSCRVAAGERKRLSLVYMRPEILDEVGVSPPTAEELDRRVGETVAWWEEWCSGGNVTGPYRDLLQQSAIVLKGLSNFPTGAIAAAATTSLPEVIGGMRNWDYRFSWIRDSVFASRALSQLGYWREADAFRRFVERSAAGSADELQVMFGVGGERHLHEHTLRFLEGYRGSGPVRIGNAAARQRQHDMYGELLDNAWRWHQGGQSPDDDYWEFLLEAVNGACRSWRKSDHGLWEVRGRGHHFVHSKVMCWAAINRGILLAADLGRPAPLGYWEKERDAVRRAVEERGYDRRRGIFIREFGRYGLDASLLLMPNTGFLAFNDERMVRTTDAIMKELTEDGLLLRYPRGIDHLPGSEGAFPACSFWLAECLARQGRTAQARKVFKRAVATGNDLLLFSEEFDMESGEMRGNFPQGLTHLSLIMAAVALAETGRRK